jgi:SAM-dependent methyltransferase
MRIITIEPPSMSASRFAEDDETPVAAKVSPRSRRDSEPVLDFGPPHSELIDLDDLEPRFPPDDLLRAIDASARAQIPLPVESSPAPELENYDLNVEVEMDEPIHNPRLSEPAAEVAPEDFVAVEHHPPALQAPAVPAIAPPPLEPMRTHPASVPPALPPQVPPVSSAGPAFKPARSPLAIVPPHAGLAPPEPSSRRKPRPWWDELFNDDFARTLTKFTDSQVTDEADFIEESLGVEKGGTILDLGCGTGRLGVELALRGFEVVAFDLSLPMLARTADDARARGASLHILQGDMRDMAFEDTFDGVFCWSTTWGYFDDETNGKVIGRVHRALKKGGQFLLDVANRDFVARNTPSLAWFDGDGCVCMDETQFDWIMSRIKVKRTLMFEDGRSREIEYAIRLYSLHELGRILHEQGFRVCEVSGRVSTPGVFFGDDSPRTLVLAEKR